MLNRRITRRQTFRLTFAALAAAIATWIAPSKRAHAGYGACSLEDGCQEYMAPANGEICANCGHNYSFHW